MSNFTSLCMIVKNEVKVIRRCLDSVKGIVDEIVVVDTGSTDGTQEIVREYTEKVYEFPWNNSFSEARNFSASKATGKWIIVLDADEYVERENLQQAINEVKNHNNKFDIYAVNIINFAGVNGELTAQHKLGRIYRNNKKILFNRSVHEQLIKIDGDPTLAVSSLTVYHSGYLSATMKEKEKTTRNTPLIEQELFKIKDNAFDYFNLGNELKNRGETEPALDCYIKAYQNNNNTNINWIPWCLCNMIECLIVLKRYDEALKIIEDAEILYSQSADFYFLRGEVYLLQHRYDDAKEVFQEIISNSKKYLDVIKSSDYKEYFPHIRLGQIYDLEKAVQNSVIHYIDAININANSSFAIMKLIQLLVKYHSEKEIFEFLSYNKLLKVEDKRFALRTLAFSSKNGLISLSNMIAKSFLSDDPLILELVTLKRDIVNNNVESLQQFRLNTTTILSGLNLGIIDMEDLFILYYKYRELVEKKDILVILSQSEIYPILQTLINDKTKVKELDKDVYINLIEKCIMYKQFDLIDSLFTIKNKFQNINGRIGNIFYRHRFKDIAIEQYELEDEENLLEQDYINIIEWLIENQIKDEALRISYNAIAKFDNDFRFYKLIYILTEDNKHHIDDEFLERFIDRFNDSKWIKSNILSLT